MKEHSPDPDLKIFALALLAICGIILGPALVAVIGAFLFGLGVTLGIGAIAGVAYLGYRARHPRAQLMPPNRPQRKEIILTPVTPCTITRYHSPRECDGYHLKIEQ